MKKTLLVLAAGLGSRFGGVKQMEGVGPNGEILMEYAIYDAVKAGFEKIVVVLKKPMLEDFEERFGKKIRESGVELEYGFQATEGDYRGIPFPEGRTKPLGTVHATLAAADVISEPFAVINADDFYGRDAFFVMSDYMDKLKENETCMCAYYLKNTVSPFGTVTRGICSEEDGYLTGVKETHKIKLNEDGSISDTEFGEPGTPLNPESYVSMNMWGYRPEMMNDMDAYMKNFLNTIGNFDPMKKECLLPDMMDDFIKAKSHSCRVLNTTERWFGLTYQEDRPIVVNSLKELHDAGVYPDNLWA